METISSSLPVLTPLLLGVVAFTVWFIQILKRICRKWKVPSWVWLMASIVLPIGIVLILNLDWIAALVAQSIGHELDFKLGSLSSLGTGVVTAIAGNGTYTTLKKLGLVNGHNPTEYVQESTTNPVNSHNLEQESPLLKDTAPTLNKAVLLQQVTPGSSGPPMYVWTGSELLPVETEHES